MNRNAKNSFMKISGAISAYRAATVETLTRYRDADERAKLDAAKYKDEQTIYAEKHSALVADARQELDAARGKLAEIITGEIDALRGVLRDHLVLRPNPGFVELLNYYRDFGMKPTETELSALLELNAGNATGLKMLTTMLEQNQSRYRVDFSAAELYEKDLKSLAALSNLAICYAPLDYHRMNVQIYEGTPRLYDGKDLGYKWNNSNLIVQSRMFESAADNIGAMSERWIGETVPSIKQLEDYEDNEDATAAEQFIEDYEATAKAATISTTPEGEAIARAIAQEQTAANEKAAEILAHYK